MEIRFLKLASHYLGSGPIALPKNTLPILNNRFSSKSKWNPGKLHGKKAPKKGREKGTRGQGPKSRQAIRPKEGPPQMYPSGLTNSFLYKSIYQCCAVILNSKKNQPPVLGFEVVRNQRNDLHILHMPVQCTSGVCFLALQSCERPSGWGIPKRTGPPPPCSAVYLTQNPFLRRNCCPFLAGKCEVNQPDIGILDFSTQKGIHCNDQKKHVGNFPIEWGFPCVAQRIPFFELPLMFLYKHTNTHKTIR
jgi:hypothetical protein